MKWLAAFFLVIISTGSLWSLSSISLDEQTDLKNKLAYFKITGERFHPMELHKIALTLFYVKSGNVAVDAGAWMGDFADLCSQLIGPRGIVLAYEASPFVFKQLQSRLGQTHNIILREKALSSSSNETVLMKTFPHNIYKQCSSIDQRVWEEIDRVESREVITQVPVVTEALDDFFASNNLTGCSFIKIDVEGHEESVIKGAEKILRHFRPVVVFEYRYIPGYFEPLSIKQFQEVGYQCFNLINLEEVSYPYLPLDLVDLVAIPVERLEQFVDLRALLQAYWQEILKDSAMQ